MADGNVFGFGHSFVVVWSWTKFMTCLSVFTVYLIRKNAVKHFLWDISIFWTITAMLPLCVYFHNFLVTPTGPPMHSTPSTTPEDSGSSYVIFILVVSPVVLLVAVLPCLIWCLVRSRGKDICFTCLPWYFSGILGCVKAYTEPWLLVM